MKNLMTSLKVMWLTAGAGAFLMQGGCLTDNFWAEKWSEIVNRSIIAAINVGLGIGTAGLPGGAYQI
jgi:hypothetical protein